MAPKRSRHTSCHSPFRVTAGALLSFLALTPTTSAEPPPSHGYLFNPQQPLQPPQRLEPERTDFQLRHIFHHGTHRHPDLLRKLDITPETAVTIASEDDPNDHQPLQSFPISSTPLRIQRLSNRTPSRIDALLTQSRTHGHPPPLPPTDWTISTLPAPNITDKETVLSFARMASNAYVTDPSTPSHGGWTEVGHGFNYTEDFGWESDGLRGHIFADTTNSTVVIGLKGTSPAVFDGAETTTNDKINDNLFFSCCCAQGGSVLWHQVCDCQSATYTCDETCLVQNVAQKERYYYAARMLYHNVTALYPESDIWLAGHSLGGAVSSLLGMTYGLPVVTFEAPGDALPASRLGLPTPPGYRVGSAGEQVSTGAFHFGHTADPIYMGTCTTCSIAGYAMESLCHTGYECRYDTVKDKGFRSYIGYHKIGTVIRDVLEAYDEPAKCEVVRDCTDCMDWKFFMGNGSSPSTTSYVESSTRHSQTRTETCETPGWWGCLDETTTTGPTSCSSATRASSTSSCKTPGWFGCLDETTTTSISRSGSLTTSTFPSASASATSSTTCKTPGWLGCYDRTSSSTHTATPAPRTSITVGPPRTGVAHTSASTPTQSCRHGWFGWDCKG